jgi:hypothetical protein
MTFSGDILLEHLHSSAGVLVKCRHFIQNAGLGQALWTQDFVSDHRLTPETDKPPVLRS